MNIWLRVSFDIWDIYQDEKGRSETNSTKGVGESNPLNSMEVL